MNIYKKRKLKNTCDIRLAFVQNVLYGKGENHTYLNIQDRCIHRIEKEKTGWNTN